MTRSPSNNPRSRFLRFSLRTLLIGMTVVGCGMGWLGWKVQQVRKQKRVVAWVQQMGGSVCYDFEISMDGNIGNGTAEPPQPKWLTKLFGIDFFCDVTWIILDGTKVSDLTRLEMTDLRMLNLDQTQVSDLTPLAGMNKLEWLNLEGTPVSDLVPLAGMDKLDFLDLEGTDVSDLTPLVGLEHVTIILNKSQKLTIPKELEDQIVWQ